MVRTWIENLTSSDPKVKYAAVRQLLEVAEIRPADLEIHLSLWIELLDSDNNILKWMATDIIGALASIDSDNRIDVVLPKIGLLLSSDKLPTKCHAIQSLGRIAAHKEHLREQILNSLFAVSKHAYKNETCKQIALGKVLSVFIEELSSYLTTGSTMDTFINEVLDNPTKTNKNKAEQLRKFLFEQADKH